MTDTQLLQAILTNGIAIRQIPLEVVSLHSMERHEEGDQVVEQPLDPKHYDWHARKHADSPNFTFDHGNKTVTRRFARKVRIPENAGWWMCQPSLGTGSTMNWMKKIHHVAPTLHESVALYLKEMGT